MNYSTDIKYVWNYLIWYTFQRCSGPIPSFLHNILLGQEILNSVLEHQYLQFYSVSHILISFQLSEQSSFKMLRRHTVHRECPLSAHTGSGKVRVTSWTLHSRDRGRLSSLTHPCIVVRRLTRSFFPLSLFLLHSLTALALVALFSTTRFLCMCFVVVSITLWWGSKSFFFSGDVLNEYPSGDKSRSAISVGSISRCNSSMNYIHRYKLTDTS